MTGPLALLVSVGFAIGFLTGFHLQSYRWCTTVHLVGLMFNDSHQTLPVVSKESRSHIIGTSLCRSPLWCNVIMLHLTQNMWLDQLPESVHFAQWLLQVDVGSNMNSDNQITVPPNMALSANFVNALMDVMYPDIKSPQPNQYFMEHTILSAKNDVDDINRAILNVFPGQ